MKKPYLRYAVLFILLAAGMTVLNFALPMREPVSFALFFAAVSCGLDPFLSAAGYLLASAASLSLAASLSAAVQGVFFLLIACVYRRFKRKIGVERVAYAAVAQLPFVFLFPHTGYALFSFSPILQKTLIGGFLVVLSLLFEGGLAALTERVCRCRLTAAEVGEVSSLWLFFGLGILGSCGEILFFAVSLSALLCAVALLKNSAALPFCIALSLPLCLFRGSLIPLAEFSVYGAAALLFSSYGRFASSISLLLAFAAACYLDGLYARGAAEIVLTLLACALPAALAACCPESLIKKGSRRLLFYREPALPRVAINRNRRAVGEQLFEVSALFREIGSAFEAGEQPDPTGELREKVIFSLCNGCPNRKSCEEGDVYRELDKLIAVGKAKGHVNLVDLPAGISRQCSNSTGMLFALNQRLNEYRRVLTELQTAREGRRLLARQARGVADVLRDIALEQSEEYSFSDEQRRLFSALAEEGLLSSEIFIYGEDASFTVSMTLPIGANGKRVAEISSRALGVPLSLSEKLPLTSDRACFIFKKRANFDAAFGLAARAKDGETASGDTHSVLKIDERRFIVALSDGMGSGEKAREVSDRTLSLIESFYKAKMPSETVLDTVNDLIAFSSEETFSCLDLAAVDLDTGVADVVKIGSPPGFVLSGETLQVLEGGSLPIGAVEVVHPSTLRVPMKEEDFLVFMSDGVTGAFGSSAELCDYLSCLHPLNPQSLAEEILKNAVGRYAGTAQDDMTVLAVKLLKG